MEKPRQDAWTEDEDIQLAEIVLRHIRHGKTQLEAFKQVANTLSRSSAACGFRWNAAIRKQHLQAIELAKYNRKHKVIEEAQSNDVSEKETIDSAITMLEKIRQQTVEQKQQEAFHQKKCMQNLQKENQALLKKIHRYEEAWGEMGKLWAWIDQNQQKENEH